MEIKNYLTKKENIVFVIACLFILLFLYAAANKLIDFQKFTVQIEQSPILNGYSGLIARFIPALEIIIALLLTAQATRLIGLYTSFGLMLMFTAYIIAILKFAERIPCSCGGILEKMDWTEHLIFNVVFTLLALTGVLIQTSIKGNKHSSDIHKNFFDQETGLTENL